MIRLVCADVPGTLQRMADAGIRMQDISADNELTVLFLIPGEDLPALKRIAQKNGVQMEIIRKTGLYWTFLGLVRRKILILGLIFFLMATWILPRRILFLKVEGNRSVSCRSILDAAEKSGIVFGASRAEVRSERMKNELLERLPQLQWAGINTYGCVAVISVRERAGEEPQSNSSVFGHVVALREGVILSCNATRGNLICKPGQAVTQGEILISGYTDCGLTIRAEQADGEVYGLTNRKLEVKTPATGLESRPTDFMKQKISLLIGKKRINIWKDSGISDMVCDRMYAEYYVTLPGGFVLPVALCVDRYLGVSLEEVSIGTNETEQLLVSFSRDYLQKQMVAGSIHRENQTIRHTQDSASLAGEYVCIELIGKMQREKIGEVNGQSD